MVSILSPVQHTPAAIVEVPSIPPSTAPWIEPGQRVRHPQQPDWGVGQVQSVVGSRVTVNFEHAGKRTMNIAAAPLDPVDDDEA